MPVSEWELWACANEMIRQHGREAPAKAGIRAYELMEQGDEEGARTWELITERAIKMLKGPVGLPN